MQNDRQHRSPLASSRLRSRSKSGSFIRIYGAFMACKSAPGTRVSPGNIFERLAQRSARGSKLTNREFLVKAMFFPARDHRGTSHDLAISFARIALSIAAAVTRNAHARQFRLGMRRAERRSVSVIDLRRLMQIPNGSFARRLDAFM